MRYRVLIASLSIAGLSACAPAVPDSGSGVYDPFGNPNAARDAALEQSNIRVPYTVRAPVGGTGAPGPVTGTEPLSGSAAATAAETTRILQATQPGGVQTTATADNVAANSGVEPLQASPSNPAPLAVNNAGISDENNFDAVAERQTIESDAERIERNRAQYEVVATQALPDRPSESGPNVVAFALQTSHPLGTRFYSRAGLNGEAKQRRNCAKYASPDQAQTDFLARGGPKRDRLGLDPDGDGYACAWDPSPFRAASKG